jgi:hypothetical protein
MRELRSSGSVGGLAGNRRVYPEADCLQRPLLRRSRFRQQLTPSVGRALQDRCPSSLHMAQGIFLHRRRSDHGQSRCQARC